VFRVKQVSKKLGVSPRTIYRWIEQGRINIVKLPSGRYRVKSDELKRLSTDNSKNRKIKLNINTRKFYYENNGG